VVLGLGAAAVRGGAFLESEDEGFGDVSDKDLRRGGMISHIMRENMRGRPSKRVSRRMNAINAITAINESFETRVAPLRPVSCYRRRADIARR